MRLHHIACELANRGFGIDIAAPTYGDHPLETIEHSPTFRETRFPKTGIYGKLHGLMDRVTPFRECSGLVCSLAARRHDALREAAEKLARDSDIFTHESPFLAPIIPGKRPGGQLLVYNSYNVEARMAADMFGRSPQGLLATAWITRQERWLARESDVILTCSEEDARVFARRYRISPTRIAVVPNGVDVTAMTPCPSVTERLLSRDVLGVGREVPVCFFIGSLHPPNIEAVDAIATRIATVMPDVTFLVAGKVCGAFGEEAMPSNVRLMGLVDEEVRRALFHGCDVALNPMSSGSGTNLKMLDAFSAGLAVLSTPFGARGLRVEHGNQAWIANPDVYTKELKRLLEDASLRARLGAAAREHVEKHFTWESIGSQVADIYTLKTGRRIVTLCDYTIHPPRHGGQARAAAVANAMERAGAHVTLLTLGKKCPASRTQISPHIEELVVPRSRLHDIADSLLARLAGTPVDDLAAWLLAGVLSRSYRREFRHEMKRTGAVLLEHCFLERMARDLPNGTSLYYDAHNSEYELKKSLGKKSWFASQLFRVARRAEHRATTRAEKIFAVTEALAGELAAITGDADRILYCPNGVRADLYMPPGPDRRKNRRSELGLGKEIHTLFLGSGHPPNQEAAIYIVGTLAGKLPDMRFVLVGRVCDSLKGVDIPKNVKLLGVLEEHEKVAWLEAVDIALNPIVSGSGSSLKVFDYLAAGLPVLSTPEGVRGLTGVEGAVHVVTRDDFLAELEKLVRDEARRGKMAEHGRELAVNQFDWEVTLSPITRYFSPDEAG